MRRSKVDIYLHVVWATYQRLPLVAPEIERKLYRSIVAEAHKCRCLVRAIGGMPDHVHLVVKMPATLAIATLAQQVKGASSTFAREQLCKGEYFNWQPGYAALSISPAHVDKVVAYVYHQKQHHATGTLHPYWEETDEAMPNPAEGVMTEQEEAFYGKG